MTEPENVIQLDKRDEKRERRGRVRDHYSDRRIYDLHYALARRHDDLHKTVTVLATSVGQLVETEANHHLAQMSLLNRLDEWTKVHQTKDDQTAYTNSFAWFLILSALVIIGVKVMLL